MHIVIIIALIALAGIGITYFFGNRSTEAPLVESPATDTQTESGDDTTEIAIIDTPPVDNQEAQGIADGTYTNTGAYTSPAGEEEVTVTLTLASGIITDAQFVGGATNPGSVNNQKKFSEGYQVEVVGKSIDEVSLGVVNGSSLTPIGFMNALEAIRTEASA